MSHGLGRPLRRNRTPILTLALVVLFLGHAPRAQALERICDVAYENCHVPLVDLIRKETIAIDVAFWFMEDTGLATELINRKNAGVAVRVLMETQANALYPANATTLKMLKDAGIPMRERTSGIMHWKFMVFAGQQTVQFSGANYSREAFMYSTKYADYVDEVIYFTHKSSIVASFMTKFDDAWVATSGWSNYANVPSPRTRSHPVSAIDPELNFPPGQNFRTRSTALYSAETTRIDAIMYRITDRTHADAVIAQAKRGLPVRLYTEPKQYRDANRLWHAYNVDRLYMAGVEIRDRAHRGLNHEKLTILVGQGTVVFGSSNWTPEAANGQQEHNLFTTEPAWYSWATAHFDRKWNNLAPYAETKPFTPLPPDTPSLRLPAQGAINQGTTVTLTWWAGPWGHKYDVYIGTSTAAMTRVLSNRQLGPSESATDTQSYTVSNLAPDTTYYWRVVSKTMANQTATSTTRSFSTGDSVTTEPPPTSSVPAGWSNRDIGAVSAAGSTNYANGVFTVNGSGSDVWGSADELHFAYTPLSGDGVITARVDSVSNTNAWTKAGVMMRETTAANSKHAFMIVSPGKGLALQYRGSTGGASSHVAGPAMTAPAWIRLTRAGSTITASVSSTGATWTTVGSATISMTATIQVGLAVSSHVDGTLATATFSNVSLGGGATEPPPVSTLPAGWSNGDVGNVSAAGSASESAGVFTVKGSGADVWGTADELHFAYRPMVGDGTVTARVDSVTNTNAWTKAGVMMRESTAAGSKHAFMLVSPGKGLALQYRASTGGTSSHAAGPSATAPYWVRLTRTGSTFRAAVSTNGSTWTTVGSATISMAATIQVGLAVSSHVDGTLATARFSGVTMP